MEGRRIITYGHPTLRRVAQALIVAVAAITLLDALGFNVTALVAGLGVGGLAVAPAAQKRIENLIGGVTLYADQPARVGDLCRFGDILGTVESIGLRSTRIRTFDRSVVSVPNAEFANLHLDNLSRRDRFWYHPTLGQRELFLPRFPRQTVDALQGSVDYPPAGSPDAAPASS